MTYLHPVAAVPNNLITNANLSYTAKRVAFVLLLLAGRKGRYVTVSFAALPGSAGAAPQPSRRL